MRITCIQCRETVEFEMSRVASGAEFFCPNCGTKLRLRVTVELAQSAEAASKAVSATSPSSQNQMNMNRAVVAVDGEATRELIVDVLKQRGLEVAEASTGKAGWALVETLSPGIILADVGLPEIFGFEFAERARKSDVLKNAVVILVASLYDKTKYRREPDTLYGADEYIERHMIEDELLVKLDRSLEKRSSEVGTIEAPEEEERPATTPEEPGKIETAALPKEASTPPPIPAVSTPPAEEKAGESQTQEHEIAKRLARIIISDIALYNQKTVEEGVRTGRFRELLHADIQEGQKLYLERTPPFIVSSTDYYNEAIEEFIKKKLAAARTA